MRKSVRKALFEQSQKAVFAQSYHGNDFARADVSARKLDRVRQKRKAERKNRYEHAFALSELNATVVFEKHAVRAEHGVAFKF